MKDKISRFAAAGFSVLMGAVCGVIMAKSLIGEGGRPLPQLIFMGCLFILIMYAAVIIHIIIHEAGHLIFGLLTGYSFSSFRIMSFMLVNTEEGLKLKRLSLAGTGGQCLMIPPPWNDGNVPVMWYNLGGALINLITGLIFLAAGIACRANPTLSAVILIFAAVGLITAAMNGIPMHAAVDNDGYNAFTLRKDQKALRAFWIQMKIGQMTAAGTRLKDMPEEWFDVPKAADMGNGLVAAIGVFAGNRMMDSHDFEDAKALYSWLLNDRNSGAVSIHKSLIACDLAYIELIGENRSQVLDRIFTKQQKKFMKAMKTFPSVIRTEYAMALLHEGDVQKAKRFKDAFEKCARKYPYPGDIESERELIDIAEAALEAAAGKAS